MSYLIVWSPIAIDNLEGVFAYIAQDSPNAARRVAAELLMLADSLSEMPGRGRRVGVEVRELVAGNYRLRYRIEDQAVVIVRLKHAAQRG
jgi:toxin ParE1/3/4